MRGEGGLARRAQPGPGQGVWGRAGSGGSGAPRSFSHPAEVGAPGGAGGVWRPTPGGRGLLGSVQRGSPIPCGPGLSALPGLPGAEGTAWPGCRLCLSLRRIQVRNYRPDEINCVKGLIFFAGEVALGRQAVPSTFVFY